MVEEEEKEVRQEALEDPMTQTPQSLKTPSEKLFLREYLELIRWKESRMALTGFLGNSQNLVTKI